jgi:hypothetical protein
MGEGVEKDPGDVFLFFFLSGIRHDCIHGSRICNVVLASGLQYYRLFLLFSKPEKQLPIFRLPYCHLFSL